MNFYCLKELDRAECKDATTAVAEKLLNSEISEEQLDAMDSEMLVSETVRLDSTCTLDELLRITSQMTSWLCL